MSKLTDSGIIQTHTGKDRVQEKSRKVCCKSTMYKISYVAILFACYDLKQKTMHSTLIGSEASG